MNYVVLIGNLGNDPETKHFDNGGSVTSFSLATSEKWKDKKSGESKEKTEWHNIVAFNALGENIVKFTKKGRKVAVFGSLTTSNYMKGDVKCYSTKVKISNIKFLDNKSGEDYNKSGNNNKAAGAHNNDNMYAKASQAVTKSSSIVDDFKDDDDIPF